MGLLHVLSLHQNWILREEGTWVRLIVEVALIEIVHALMRHRNSNWLRVLMGTTALSLLVMLREKRWVLVRVLWVLRMLRRHLHKLRYLLVNLTLVSVELGLLKRHLVWIVVIRPLMLRWNAIKLTAKYQRRSIVEGIDNIGRGRVHISVRVRVSLESWRLQRSLKVLPLNRLSLNGQFELVLQPTVGSWALE